MSLALNKTSLKQQRDQLAMYQQYLPSLDLKRQQLLVDLQHSKNKLKSTEREISDVLDSQAGLFSLLGASDQNLTDLVRVEAMVVDEENVLGVRLPMLVKFSSASKSTRDVGQAFLGRFRR
ncbi:MAG: V-type ATP synthase subunit D [Pirellulaceae bacterium]